MAWETLLRVLVTCGGGWWDLNAEKGCWWELESPRTSGECKDWFLAQAGRRYNYCQEIRRWRRKGDQYQWAKEPSIPKTSIGIQITVTLPWIQLEGGSNFQKVYILYAASSGVKSTQIAASEVELHKGMEEMTRVLNSKGLDGTWSKRSFSVPLLRECTSPSLWARERVKSRSCGVVYFSLELPALCNTKVLKTAAGKGGGFGE